ncbi:hypothetical protein Tco_1363989, partial [Tanacetum coccineum]
MESSTSSPPNQPYYMINPIILDMNFKDLMFSQEYNYRQNYSMGHGSGHSSALAKVKKDEPKEVRETPKEWTVEEEIALCQGWCDVSENSISGNSMKAKGFWEAF